MTPEDLKFLAERASTVEGRPEARLDEVRSRIRTARRRRQLGAVTATVVAVVLALTVGSAVLFLTDTDQTPPANPPRPTETPSVVEENQSSVRPLTFAVDQTIHYGDRTIDVSQYVDREVDHVDTTDDGVVFISSERLSAVSSYTDIWFTDGSDTVKIGHTYGSPARGYEMKAAATGSILAWWEASLPVRHRVDRERGEIVVYDTHEGRVVARLPVVARFPGSYGPIQTVYDDYVYWVPDENWCVDLDRGFRQCLRYRGVMRLETSTGEQTEVSWAAYQADRRSRPRMLSGPYTGDAGLAGPVFHENTAFVRVGDRLVAHDRDVDFTAREARTDKALRLRLPSGYTSADTFELVQWLDDDRVAVFAYRDRMTEIADAGDIFVCRLSSGRCTLAVKGSGSARYQLPMAD